MPHLAGRRFPGPMWYLWWMTKYQAIGLLLGGAAGVTGYTHGIQAMLIYWSVPAVVALAVAGYRDWTRRRMRD